MSSNKGLGHGIQVLEGSKVARTVAAARAAVQDQRPGGIDHEEHM